MKVFLITPALALLAATGAVAQTTTKTADGPNYEATRTTVIDPTTGTASRDSSVTRKADGATATRQIDRTRTDSGVTIQGSSSNFAGETRSADYNRTRTDTGSSATGSFTRRNGETLTYDGSRTRADGTVTGQQSVTGADGQSLYSRTATRSRTDAGVSRSVNATRAPGVRPPASLQARARRR